MKLLEEVLAYNEKFVENKEYEPYQTDKLPNKKVVILSCMDTRLVELLPKSIDIANGDAKVVKSAGALIGDPYGSVMRSILVAVYELQADEVMVIGHYDCGMAGLKAENTVEKMKKRGITEETLETLQYSGVNLDEFLYGFEDVEESVQHSVTSILHHPLMPKDVPVHGLVIEPKTGKLTPVVNGYESN